MKVKTLFMIALFSIFLLSIAFAQEEAPKEPKYGWQKEMIGGLNLTQTSFDNWAQGGENSFAWQINLNFKFINDQEKFNWANTGKFNYGSTKTGDQEAKKSIDEIKLETVYTYKLAKFLNPFVAATGESQFAPGYNYGTEPKTQISAIFDPAYFRESIGLGYKPNDLVQTRLGGAVKQTITSDYPAPYADDPETEEIEKFKNEFGVESVTDISLKISENSLLTSKLELFSAFEAFDKTDVNWDNLISTKISKYFNITFNFKLFYDKDISAKRQIKQSIALGVSYTFI
ncbi:hypothetical protein B6I21_07140 [candidate division KSB1 bacterium 4572_119]|nr:MAG: hypothetical protein B6I21_07140 [candidate division KSB1 bacterium 4572_119]